MQRANRFVVAAPAPTSWGSAGAESVSLWILFLQSASPRPLNLDSLAARVSWPTPFDVTGSLSRSIRGGGRGSMGADSTLPWLDGKTPPRLAEPLYPLDRNTQPLLQRPWGSGFGVL